jgi:hypothetical protein
LTGSNGSTGVPSSSAEKAAAQPEGDQQQAVALLGERGPRAEVVPPPEDVAVPYARSSRTVLANSGM